MSNNKPIPLVSVGVPVYNGGKVLRRALDSILSQDYSRVEIIVSDNASTDETEEICKEFSTKDNRISYYRSEKNMGVVWNFNSLVKFSKGKYFMWLSCDDFCAPDYLSKCVALLEANEKAVLCHSFTSAFFGDVDNVLATFTLDSMEGIIRPQKRFITALKNPPAIAMNGLIRTEILKTCVRPMENYIGSDIVLILELSLYGEFVQVPEILFWRSGKTILSSPQKIYSSYGYEMGNTMISERYPFLRLGFNHIKSIFRSPLSIKPKLSLVILLVQHDAKIIFAKALFRAGTSIMGANFPEFLLRRIILMVENNPNVRYKKHPSELPPSLQPTWKLFNHRDPKKAESLQPLLVEKLFKK